MLGNKNNLKKRNYYKFFAKKNSKYLFQFNRKLDGGVHPELMCVISEKIANY